MLVFMQYKITKRYQSLLRFLINRLNKKDKKINQISSRVLAHKFCKANIINKDNE